MSLKSFKKPLTLFTLTMLITGSADSIRNFPTTALFGSTLIFFLLLAGIFFLIPTALISAQLASALPQKSGIYHWAKLAFGKKSACLAIWLQWINTMVWFPTILSFIGATIAYLINPALAQNKAYLVATILGIYWLITLFNLKGIRYSARLASICAIFGMIIPIILIIALAASWLLLGHSPQIHLTSRSLFPKLGHSETWISLTAIMTAFLGMELATVHVNQADRPQTTFPRALFLSLAITLITMLLGSLSIAIILAPQDISLVAGVTQAFSYFFVAYHLEWMRPIIPLMLLIGSIGGMINWLISPAKGLLQAAEDGFFPSYLAKQNQYAVPARLLILQALLVSLICTAFLLMPSVNASYWLLTDLSTELYMLMYVMMFAAAIKLSKKINYSACAFALPGKAFSMQLIALLGGIGSTITIIVGFLPPHHIKIGSKLHYDIVFTLGLLCMILPVFGLFAYRHRQSYE